MLVAYIDEKLREGVTVFKNCKVFHEKKDIQIFIQI